MGEVGRGEGRTGELLAKNDQICKEFQGFLEYEGRAKSSVTNRLT